MVFKTMFERATAFSAVFVFIVFSVVGKKYLNFMQAESQNRIDSLTTSQQNVKEVEN